MRRMPSLVYKLCDASKSRERAPKANPALQQLRRELPAPCISSLLKIRLKVIKIIKEISGWYFLLSLISISLFQYPIYPSIDGNYYK
jgi:hypothetical protein